MSIVKGRPPTLKEVSKVNTQEFIDQKKEMFLVQMGHEIIMKEIEMFKRNAEEKSEALKQSENRLKNDEMELKTNRDANADETAKIAEEVNKLENDKKNYENKLKLECQKRDFLESEIKKNGEVEQRLKKLEDFFDKITPKVIIADKSALRKVETIVDKDKRLTMEKNQSEMPAVTETDKTMYFKEPQQLFDIFTNIEKENLNLITEVQELEKTLDDERKSLATIKLTAEERIKKLKGNFDMHKAEMRQHEAELKIRESLHIDKDSSKNKEWLDALRSKIVEIYKSIDPKFDVKTKSTLSMLAVY